MKLLFLFAILTNANSSSYLSQVGRCSFTIERVLRFRATELFGNRFFDTSYGVVQNYMRLIPRAYRRPFCEYLFANPFPTINDLYPFFAEIDSHWTGYGSVSPRTTWGKLVTIIYALVGIPLMLLYLSTTGDILARSVRRLYGKLCGPSQAVSASNHRSNGIKTPLDGMGPQCPCGAQEVKVPVTLCLVIVLAYIGLGAFLFQSLENWSLLEGSYFCFTSLGTIGFGDLLPGQHHSHQQHVSLFACSAYILTGMALVAMCFTLVQDEILTLLRLVTTTTQPFPTTFPHNHHHNQHCYCQQTSASFTGSNTSSGKQQPDIA